MRRPIVKKPTAPVALVLAVLAGLPGCSFVFVEKAPPREEWPDSNFSLTSMKGCTETKTPVYLDVGAAVGIESIIPIVWIFQHFDPPAQSPESDLDPGFLAVVSAVVMTVVAAPFVISGVWGNHEIDRCRRYKVGPPYDDYDRGG